MTQAAPDSFSTSFSSSDDAVHQFEAQSQMCPGHEGTFQRILVRTFQLAGETFTGFMFRRL